MRVASKLYFSGPAQSVFTSVGKLGALQVQDARGCGAIFDSILVIPAYACAGWHFYELSQEPSGANRSIAIVDETSNVTAGVARVSYCVAVNVQEPDTKAVMVGVTAVAGVCTAGLQVGEAFIGMG